MNDLMTPTARRIVAALTARGDELARQADDDITPSYLRSLLMAKAETYRALARELPRDLVDVEREAVDIEVSECARIDALMDTFEGVPA